LAAAREGGWGGGVVWGGGGGGGGGGWGGGGGAGPAIFVCRECVEGEVEVVLWSGTWVEWRGGVPGGKSNSRQIKLIRLVKRVRQKLPFAAVPPVSSA
jgi:hypothetical protein